MKIPNRGGATREQDGAGKLGTIQCMEGIFGPEDLSVLFGGLEAAGFRCELFGDLPRALSDARARLFLLKATEENWPALVEALRSDDYNAQGAPVLVYFEDLLRQGVQEMLVPEIDDFLIGPVDPEYVRVRILRQVQLFAKRQDEVEHARGNLISYFGTRQFIGQSPAFLSAVEKIPRIAACAVGVLLTGETGTGKELCARSLHYLSPRAGRPFVPVNCGAIPHDLFENELFGHEHGAFTGASKSRRGLIAEAEGGTLFLDEVDSMPLSSQVKLLRFIQERQYKPLGASGYRQADVRIVAATNNDLMEKVRSGAFREDLYYRLKVFTLRLPPLRERHGDIAPLAEHFLKMAAEEYGRSVTQLSHDAIRKLSSYQWPGNVRELENIIRQAVVLAEGRVIRAEHLHLPVEESPAPAAPAFSFMSLTKEPLKAAKARVVEEFERNYLREVMSSCGGNISKAAREARKDRRTFFALLKKYELTSRDAELMAG